MSIRFHSDDNLNLKKTLELHSMIIFVRSGFHDGNKHNVQTFLNECLTILIKRMAHMCVLFVIIDTFSRSILDFKQNYPMVVMM